jgi:hypothetical protein
MTVRISKQRNKPSREKSIRMGNPNPKQDRPSVITTLVVIGFGIGWLARLSVTLSITQ